MTTPKLDALIDSLDKDCSGWTPGKHCVCDAKELGRRLFGEHGPALVAVLKESLDSFCITQDLRIYPSNHWSHKAAKILAQLEQEAG